MIQRATAAHTGYINDIANDPDVNPHLGGKPMDLTELLAESVSFVTEGGAIIFTPINNAAYQFHSLFMPEARGKIALKAARHAAFEMFTTTDAMELITYTADDTPHARPPRTFGFKPWFKRPNSVFGKDTTWFRLSVHDWIMRDKGCLKKGKKFHAQLEALEAHEDHADDDAHNRYVGASVAMSQGGKPDKGLMIYNTFAGASGYHASVIKSREPLQVFTGDALWTLNSNNSLEVEICR
jgi:hypothetical protein